MKYLDYIKGTYNRIKAQGYITNNCGLWSDMDECDDLYYYINKACFNLYGQGVQAITTTPKCVKMILNDGQTKFVKKD
ncbi:hypothetical protein [Staphylococcus phage vB_SauM-HM01]|nr:hypothetical protein [Staphylococcus phage vB_SauM-HM01]